MAVSVDRDGAVLRVWLDRPVVHNALDDETLEAVAMGFTDASADTDIRLVILAGRGPSFSSGADRTRPPGQGGASARERRWRAEVGYRACRAIARCQAVTLCRLHGNVIGGGLSLAVSCDLRIAAHTAVFALPEVTLGLPLTWGTVPRLVNEIGLARARELTLLGRSFDADRAREYGIVHEVVDRNHLDATVESTAAAILDLPQLAVDITKSQFRAYDERRGDASYAEADLFNLSLGEPEAAARFGRAAPTADRVRDPED